MDGLELCRLVKAVPRFSYVILMTVRGELDDKIDALECGVDEYLVKPVDHRELAARIRAGARIIAANRALEAESRTDRLTALKNRRAFEETLAYEVARAGRSGRPFCLIFGDVDHFKSVNDRYGHRVGDHLLTAVGAALGQTLRKTDHVFRLGGDEFAMILPDCPLDASAQWTARMRAAIAGVQIPDLDHPVGLSFGVVAFDPARPVPIEDLIGKADEQMYLAKRSSYRTA
jgi:diguanylate cyclase (GGDEF)-like protein